MAWPMRFARQLWRRAPVAVVRHAPRRFSKVSDAIAARAQAAKEELAILAQAFQRYDGAPRRAPFESSKLRRSLIDV